jgi:hypothetical protein
VLIAALPADNYLEIYKEGVVLKTKVSGRAHPKRGRSEPNPRLLSLICVAALALPLLGCGGGSETSSPSSPQNPVPIISALSPSSAPAGSREISLMIIGSNFLSGSVVRWNGADRATSYVNNMRLTASVSPDDLSSSGEASVTVYNPAPGGGTSGRAVFRITAVDPISLLTTSLPAAFHTKEYDYSMKASGGIPPYSWSIAGGSLPEGLDLSDSGDISGTAPVVADNTTSNFEIRISDDAYQPNTLNQSLSILVRADSLGRNETCGTATPVSNGVIGASISPLGDIDVFSFQGTAGNAVEIETYARRLDLQGGSGGDTFFIENQLDTFLELLDSDCNRMTSNDDIDLGVIQDSLISNFVLPYTGTYFIRVSDLRGDGRPDFPYELHLSGAD